MFLIGKIRQIFASSPWDDPDSGDSNNIFTRQRSKPTINFDNFQFNFRLVFIGAAALLLLWLASGIYEVKEGEEAAIIRFGKFERKGMPGLNYHLPAPIEYVIIEKVNQSRRIEIGYRSTSSLRQDGSQPSRDIVAESTMVTGDQNILELSADVMWHISDLQKYIFSVLNPQDTVKVAAESAIREIIGNTPILSILSDQKQEITEKIESLTQEILNQYNTGVMIEQVQLLKAEPPQKVIQAYRDVQSSKADKERNINQAQSYSNDILPRARGEAARVEEEAKGYKEEVIARAKGDVARFEAIYRQYSTNKDLTRSWLYIEALEEMLKGADKTLISNESMLPHMAIGKGKGDKQ